MFIIIMIKTLIRIMMTKKMTMMMTTMMMTTMMMTTMMMTMHTGAVVVVDLNLGGLQVLHHVVLLGSELDTLLLLVGDLAHQAYMRTDRQTRETDKQTDRQTRQTDRQDRQKDKT